MKAMIFAAGLGTRLRPLTDTLPKALVPVGGTPLLGHVLQKLYAAGYDDIVVNVHHFADDIIAYINSLDFPGKISISEERDYLRETGGGIRHARPLLQGAGGFLVHNVDILSNVDFGWLRSCARPGAISTILVSERKTQRYLLFDESMRLAGWTNLATGQVKSPHGTIDPKKYKMLAFAGIHYMSDDIFRAFDNEKVDDRFPIIDFYVSVCDKYPIYGAQAPGLKILDIGKIETLSTAETFLRSL